MQAAAVAATTFVAGAGLAAVLKGRRGRRAARRFRRGRRDLPIVATRSFLVDVHVLDPAQVAAQAANATVRLRRGSDVPPYVTLASSSSLAVAVVAA